MCESKSTTSRVAVAYIAETGIVTAQLTMQDDGTTYFHDHKNMNSMKQFVDKKYGLTALRQF